MPATQVFFFQDKQDIPVRSWLQELRRTDKRVYAKCVARIRLLAQLGHELRIRRGRVNYRILYFFHGQNIAILTHGLVKEDVIPQADLTRAIKRKEAFLKDPEKHTYEENISHA